MCAVLDDLVVALYVTVDELLGKRSRPGRPPRLSDAELVCLAVAQVLATPKLGEREVAAALLGGWPATRLLRPGMVIAADKGLAGHRFAQGVGQLGAVLVRPDRRDEPHRWGSLGGIRQWIEGMIDTLKDQLGLERHGAIPARVVGAGHPAAAGLGRRDLVQLAARRRRQAQPGRLRPGVQIPSAPPPQKRRSACP